MSTIDPVPSSNSAVSSGSSVSTGFYGRLYDRLYARGYHRGPDYSHAKVLAERLLAFHTPTSILDVGCAQGWSVEWFAMHGVPACGVDVSSVAVRRGRRLGRDVRLASATRLPFDDGAFDTVLSTDCLEHMRPEDAPTAVAEMARVSSRLVAIKVNPRPDRNRWWRWVAGTSLHLTCQPVEWWFERFAAHGFAVVGSDDPREEYILERREQAA